MDGRMFKAGDTAMLWFDDHENPTIARHGRNHGYGDVKINLEREEFPFRHGDAVVIQKVCNHDDRDIYTIKGDPDGWYLEAGVCLFPVEDDHSFDGLEELL